jgi:cell division protein FtsQ
MSRGWRSTLLGPGLHKRGRRAGGRRQGGEAGLFDIEAVEARAEVASARSTHPAAASLAPPVRAKAETSPAPPPTPVRAAVTVATLPNNGPPTGADAAGTDAGARQFAATPLPVDPRFHERRRAVIQEATRRRQQLAVAALSAVTVAVLSVLAVHSALFGVRHVRVRGAVHTDLGLIARTAGLDSSTPMVDVDGSAIAGRLLRLPWVGTVRVTRVWPATVRIQIAERTPVAIAPAGPTAGGARWALVDQTGRVLAVTDDPPGNLLRLTGVAAAGLPGTQLTSEAGAALAVAASLPPDLVARLATVGPATPHRDDLNTDMTLRGTGLVLWGSPDDAADKIVALRTVLTRVDLTRLAAIDVRVPQAPTVRRS